MAKIQMKKLRDLAIAFAEDTFTETARAHMIEHHSRLINRGKWVEATEFLTMIIRMAQFADEYGFVWDRSDNIHKPQ